MTHITEKKIISLIRERNQKGIAQLYSQYANALFGIILRTLKDRNIAEEVLQQTMLKAWNNFDSYRENKGTLFTWLTTIARNSSIDAMRKKSFQIKKKTDSIDILVINHNINITDTSSIDVKKLIGGLDEKYRIVLEKVYLEGFSQSEAAEALAIPIGTVKTRLRFAISHLREELKNEKQLFLGLLILFITIVLIWL